MGRTQRVAGAVLSASLALTVATGLAPTAMAAPAACTWQQTILPLPSGAPTGEVWASDNNGGYAGTVSFGADSANGEPAVLWKNGKITNLGLLAGHQKYVSVTGVNQAGTVVGSAPKNTGFGEPTAFRSRNGKLAALPELPKAIGSTAQAVNERGDIVGGVLTEDQIWQPVIWPADKPGTVVRLTGLPTGGNSIVEGIDKDGTLLVSYDHPTRSRVGYLWKDGTAHELAMPEDAYDVVLRGISNGRVIGQVSYGKGGDGPLLWDRDGKPSVPPRAADLQGINRDGQLVGRTDDPSRHEFGVWKAGKLDSTISYTADHGLELHVSSDDGSIAGRSWKFPGGFDQPTVWRCS